MADKKRKRVALTIDEQELKLFKEDAKDMGLTLSQYVELMLAAGSPRLGPEAERANEALQYYRDKAWIR